MKLSEIVDRLEDGKLTIKRIKLTPYEASVIFVLYNGSAHTFISENIKHLFDKCGIKTLSDMNGWRLA